MTFTLESRSHKLHHVTYASAKFEDATSNMKYIIYRITCCLVLSTSVDLCTCKIWSCCVQQFRRRCIFKKKNIWTWPLGQGHTKRRSVHSTPIDLCIYIEVWICSSNSLGEDAFTRKNIIWPLTRSYEVLPSTLYIMWPMRTDIVTKLIYPIFLTNIYPVRYSPPIHRLKHLKAKHILFFILWITVSWLWLLCYNRKHATTIYIDHPEEKNA